MSYFDIYKKRLNATGLTSQERIMSSKEKESNKFLNQSLYKVKVTLGEEDFIGSLQPSKFNENKSICTLLTEKGKNLAVGSLLKIENGVELFSNWIILHFEKYTKNGYDKYKVIEANYTITWKDDDIECSSLVYLTGSMDKVASDLFKIVDKVDYYRQPDQQLSIIIPTNDNFKKDTYFELNDDAWIVESIDKISVPGLYYAVLSQTLKRNKEKDSNESNDNFWLGGRNGDSE